MKRISSIIFVFFIAMLLCMGCHTTLCPAFQITEFTYGPFEYAEKVLTYCNMDDDSMISFYCGAVDASKEYTENGYPKSCGAYAEQILTSNHDTIRYYYMSATYCSTCDPLAWDNESSSIELSIEGTFLHFGFTKMDIRDETNEYAQLLPAWTSADGTRYENVYHLVPDNGTALYLAPGYGIVQIETAGKTYCLKL